MFEMVLNDFQRSKNIVSIPDDFYDLSEELQRSKKCSVVVSEDVWDGPERFPAI